MRVTTVFENFEDGLTVDEIVEQFDVTREQIVSVPDFRSPQAWNTSSVLMLMLFDQGTP